MNKPFNDKETTDKMTVQRIFRVWHIGGDDVRLRISLLKALEQRGFYIGAVGSEKGDAFKEHGIEYHIYPLQRGLNPCADVRSIYKLCRLFRKMKMTIDIVHAFDTKPYFFVPIAACFADIPVVIRTIPGMGYIFSSKDCLSKVLRPVYCGLQVLINKIVDMTVFQNADDCKYFMKHRMVDKGKQKVILGSGIDLNLFDPKQIRSERLAVLRDELGVKDEEVVILIARLIRDKGIAEYLEAARVLRRDNVRATFLLVGPEESERRQAVSLNLIKEYSNEVVYLGRRDDVRELLGISDLFVLPSYYREGIPRVLLEAGAMELPMITTDMPGCREVVRNHWNGLIVPTRDVDSLSKAIKRLIDNKEQRQLMGERSRSHIRRNFDLELVADAYAALYRELLDNSGSRYSVNQFSL